MIRVTLPFHLRNLAGVEEEVILVLSEPVTLEKVLGDLERSYPVLKGTIRDFQTGKRRPFIRFFICKEDWSHEPVDTTLPQEVVQGKEPVMIRGAMAGG